MQAIMSTRLVKIASGHAKAEIAQAKPVQATAQQRKTGKSFLALLLSALAAWEA